MTAYYNEIDPQAAAWLRELIKQNLIAPGVVDKRSIEDVRPAELLQYTQCHFFAGIGVWSYALRQAGWPDDRPVWTGSCPCQPFSAAGKGAEFADERHLWPAFDWLIGQCRPVTVFGEQVAGKAGETWLDLVSTDLENKGYTCGSVVTAACGFGAPHQRKRLYWVADSAGKRHNGEHALLQWEESRRELQNSMEASGGEQISFMEQPQHQHQRSTRQQSKRVRDTIGAGEISFMADADRARWRQIGRNPESNRKEGIEQETDRISNAGENGKRSRMDKCAHTGPTNGFWRDVDWLLCRDGKWRPVEPGTFPLANGAASEMVHSSGLSLQDVESTKEARVMRLRGYGNAVTLYQASSFIESYMEIET